jgi:hypothetical protein
MKKLAARNPYFSFHDARTGNYISRALMTFENGAPTLKLPHGRTVLGYSQIGLFELKAIGSTIGPSVASAGRAMRGVAKVVPALMALYIVFDGTRAAVIVDKIETAESRPSIDARSLVPSNDEISAAGSSPAEQEIESPPAADHSTD